MRCENVRRKMPRSRLSRKSGWILPYKFVMRAGKVELKKGCGQLKSGAAAAAAKSLQSCPTLRPQRRQPTRLPCPWDSPGKNTGVGCHLLLQCMKVKVKSPRSVRPSATPWTATFQAPLSMGFSRQKYWSGVPLPSPKVGRDVLFEGILTVCVAGGRCLF